MWGWVVSTTLHTDQFHRPNHKQQNDGEHHRIFGDILGVSTSPNGAAALSEFVHARCGGSTNIEVALPTIYRTRVTVTMAQKCHYLIRSAV